MQMTIKRANALYKKLLRQYGMKEGFNVDRHIKNAYLSVGNCGFEILRLCMPEDTSLEVTIYVFTKFIQLECSERFIGWTNTGEMVSSEEDAHKLIDNIIKQLKDGYIKHKKELIERDFNDYQRCSKSN